MEAVITYLVASYYRLTASLLRPIAARSQRAANMVEYALLGAIAVGLFIVLFTPLRSFVQNAVKGITDKGNQGLSN